MSSKRNPISQSSAFNLDEVQLMIAGDIDLNDESISRSTLHYPSILSSKELKSLKNLLFPLSPRHPDGSDLRQLFTYGILPYPSYILTDFQYGWNQTSLEFLKAFGTPSSYIVVADGKIKYNYTGFRSGKGYPYRLINMHWLENRYVEELVDFSKDIKLSNGDIVVGWLEHTRKNLINSEHRLTSDGMNSFRWEIKIAAPIFAIFKKQ